MYLIFDVETTGLPKRYDAPISELDNWPRCVQIAWQFHDEWGSLIESKDYVIKPDDFDIPYQAEQIHGISTELANEIGIDLKNALNEFNAAIEKCQFIVGQNVDFDIKVTGSEFYRAGISTKLSEKPVLDTCTETTAQLCQIPGGKGGKFKLPKLSELHEHLFGVSFEEAHNATADVEATTRCFLELIRTRVFTIQELQAAPDYPDAFIKKHPNPIQPIGLKHLNFKLESEKLRQKKAEKLEDTQKDTKLSELQDVAFSHLHNHSQFSILESTISVQSLLHQAHKQNMPAVALTDLGNMMGAFSFVEEAAKINSNIEKENKKKYLVAKNEKLLEEEGPESENIIAIDQLGDKDFEKIKIDLEEAKALNVKIQEGIKPIMGSEFYICENHLDKKRKDNGFRTVLLAKNKNGYHNLTKLSSLSHTEGFYYVPRIDKKLLLEYKKDLIVLSGNLQGEIAFNILNVGEKQAEEALLWWKENFGEDYYLEVADHGLDTEKRVNEVIKAFSEKHQVKVVATNDTYYLQEEDAEAQDILVCVKEGEQQSTPKGRGRGYRRGLANDQYYFKSPDEMKLLFAHWPEAIKNIDEIVQKIETYRLAREVLLPKFSIPVEFEVAEDKMDNGVRGEQAYLKHLTYQGAQKRWGDITPKIQERLEYELEIIKSSGYPGYFLIVQDLIAEARKMGVSVGPGRGSAAGSAVAYCLWITNIDPIKYDLLFERFLNPDRISLPDIDIDFDDEGRQKVIEYVTDKYGQKNVAQIITYGTLGAKSSIRDTGRVMELPLHETDRLAKLVPNIKLNTIFKDSEKNKSKLKGLRKEEQLKVNEIKNIADGDDLEAITIQQAQKIEGSIRNTGVHACGFIITPEEITNLIPIATAKDTDMYVTQFDNSVVENAGLLKMDFLGLKTLSLIKDTVEIVAATNGIKLDPDNFPLDDEKTYELFQKGETIGIFQFESEGMRKSLKDLKPTEFADLIAMVSLYRPGPMDYIPQYIERKHGISQIEYDLPEMEEMLKETYGVTVYQEQVMRLSQKLANFTRGEADNLRKAMGKKLIDILSALKPKFIENGYNNGHPKKILEKIWKDWEKFASYAFNKSHATCYAFIAFQTAYLKAHYPSEFMAATLSNNMSDIKKVTFYMDECKHSGILVLGPDINESWYKFAVNKKGAIRFGMGGIKGVGQGAVENIIAERKKNGRYSSIFDFARRVDLRAVNKRVFEGLALAGGFDSFTNIKRSNFFVVDEGGKLFIDKLIRYGNRVQDDASSAQMSLFGGQDNQSNFQEPLIPQAEEWNVMEKLSKEKSVVGIFISGHPLDDYKFELTNFCNAPLNLLQDPVPLLDKELRIGGIITDVKHRVSKNGNGWGQFTVEDYTDSSTFNIFGEDYLKFKHFLINNAFIYMKIKYIKGWKEGDVRLQFIQIMLLDDVIKTLSKRLTFDISIDEVNQNLIDNLFNISKTYKGKKEMDINIYDMDNAIKLYMKGHKYKVEIDKELIDELRAQQWRFSVK